MDPQALHKAMLQPQTYPGERGPIGYRETHVSRLYLTRRHVYKVKKPVDFGFLNFTTLDRRRFYCQEEVDLNRRLCPEIYLGVVELRCREGRVVLDEEGEIIEYAVQMKRLPERRMLDHLLEREAPGLEFQMERLAARLATFHRGAEICPGHGARNNLELVRLNWRENFFQTEAFAGSTLAPPAHALLSTYVKVFLQHHGALLLRRQQAGYVRDGHGDLHAEHVCLTDPICIYDCIEFNRRFRIGDIAGDLAFLLMDLDFRRRRDLAARLLEAYRLQMPADPDLDHLLPFYKIYRAFVRGKVESFLSAAPEATAQTRAAAATRARRYFNLALGYLVAPRLILTCGLMGTGKTTLASSLAEATDAALLRSDVVRKKLAGIPPKHHSQDAFGAGIYREDFTRRTYDQLLRSTRALLQQGRGVIVDASFARQAERQRFREAAEALGIPCLILAVGCERRLILERLAQRRFRGDDASDGREEIFDAQAATFAAPLPQEATLPVDTSGDVDYTVNLILCRLATIPE